MVFANVVLDIRRRLVIAFNEMSRLDKMGNMLAVMSDFQLSKYLAIPYRENVLLYIVLLSWNGYIL